MNNEKINLLDRGFVRLVDSMGNDLSIIRNARVSYDAEWRTGKDSKKDANLMKYLFFNGHNTPFEAVTFTFDVKAPIFVLRQWMRHRTQSFNELSARYKELPGEFYIPKIEQVGTQSKDNKQMRNINELEYDKETALIAISLMKQQNTLAFDTYKALISKNIPRELARTVLPVATYSHMFCTVNLHNLFKFLSERLHEHAQYEIQVYAEAILKLIEPVVPVATSIFKESLKQ